VPVLAVPVLWSSHHTAFLDAPIPSTMLPVDRQQALLDHRDE
jgi:hypothetical protein